MCEGGSARTSYDKAYVGCIQKFQPKYHHIMPGEPERSENISPAVFATQLPENYRTKSLIPAGPIEPRTSSLIVEALTYPWGSLLLFRRVSKRGESYEGPMQQRKTRVELPKLGSKAGEFRSIDGPCFFYRCYPSKNTFFSSSLAQEPLLGRCSTCIVW